MTNDISDLIYAGNFLCQVGNGASSTGRIRRRAMPSVIYLRVDDVLVDVGGEFESLGKRVHFFLRDPRIRIHREPFEFLHTVDRHSLRFFI